jgi:DNA-binding response OmpR family regulator
MNGPILIADDDPDLRATVRLALGSEFTLLEAAGGREAVELARRERPRLVLLDNKMPRMGGLEALAALKALLPAVTVIMLTSGRDVAVARRALDLGAAAYVTKPFDLDFLRAEIRRLLAARAEGAPGGPSERPWRRAD